MLSQFTIASHATRQHRSQHLPELFRPELFLKLSATCLGWNIVNAIEVPASLKRLAAAEALLWKGKVDETIALFKNLNRKQAHNFCDYLTKHRHRIVNYDYYQAENICSIGSGAVESAMKQISRRVKISGAQWKAKNVPQVLAHRAAYLNELLFSS